jgi:hypothetical protein
MRASWMRMGVWFTCDERRAERSASVCVVTQFVAAILTPGLNSDQTSKRHGPHSDYVCAGHVILFEMQ